VVELIDETLKKPEDQKHITSVKKKVNGFVKKFPLYK
jgi:glycine/serine hydroxymethyltransferase